MTIRLLYLFSLSALLNAPAMLQESSEEYDSHENFHPQNSPDQVLEFMLGSLNDYFHRSSLTSFPVKETINGTNLYGGNVWGVHLATVNGEVISEASLIAVNLEFPFLQFTLFADTDHDEGIVIVKLYNLDVRVLIYFNEDMDVYNYLDSYIRGYTHMTVENTGTGKKSNLKFSADLTALLDLLIGSFKEFSKISEIFDPTKTEYKLRNIIRN